MERVRRALYRVDVRGAELESFVREETVSIDDYEASGG